NKYHKSMVTLAAVAALADTARPVQLAIGGNVIITRNKLIETFANELKAAEKSLKDALALKEKEESVFKAKLKIMCQLNVKKNTDGVLERAESTDPELCENIAVDEKEKKVDEFCGLESEKNKEDCKKYKETQKTKNTVSESHKEAKSVVSKTKADLEAAKSNSDISVGGVVSWAKPSISQPSKENVAAVARVVRTLVTQTYAHDLYKECLEISKQILLLDNSMTKALLGFTFSEDASLDDDARINRKEVLFSQKVTGSLNQITLSDNQLKALPLNDLNSVISYNSTIKNFKALTKQISLKQTLMENLQCNALLSSFSECNDCN
ncbi:MAG: hypothetical protein L3J83_11565, partial [Proteobacteria bacterium]|nr:hypothetical protein [Pseudomonadota bacterium]